MKESIRYKTCLCMVWAQVALIPIAYLMMQIVDGEPYLWRWNLFSWIILTGYLIGFIALPLSRGCGKPKFLKWWLRIDFVVTVLLFPIFFFTFPCSWVNYIAKSDKYVLYRTGGFLAAPTVYMGVNDGVFIKEIKCIQGFGSMDSPLDWAIDDSNGYCKIHLRDLCYSSINVFPIDSALYHERQTVVNKRIDSLFYTRCDNDETLIFVMPEDFSMIEYVDSSWISYYREGDHYADIQYRSYDNQKVLDSILVRFAETKYSGNNIQIESIVTKEVIKFPKDSLPWMSPTEAYRFINNVEGGKR